MRFVKLTREDGKEFYINIHHIISLSRDADITVLATIEGYVTNVKETPEEILIKLPTIGG